MDYTGGIYDKSTGLYYLNARYYDPENGRFLTEDTYRGEAGDPDTWHLYAYCNNDPVNYVDPSGHWKYKDKNGTMTSTGKYLRVCTDGKISGKLVKKSQKPYGDKNHQMYTACFSNQNKKQNISSDRVPYIVIPKSKSKYKYSFGVIINQKNNEHLYCVVADLGPNDKGMGEVSIYAAWKMMHKLKSRPNIGNKDQKGDWKIKVYNNTSPNKNDTYCGWPINDSKLNAEIKEKGKLKKYKLKGKCLN